MILIFDLTISTSVGVSMMKARWITANPKAAVGHHLTRAGELQREALDCWADMEAAPRCAVLMALAAWHLEQAFKLSAEHWRD